MIIYAQILLILFVTVSAIRDGVVYKLRGTRIKPIEEVVRLNKWYHGIGVIINLALLIPLAYFISWKLSIAALLIRLSIFDIICNAASGLPYNHLGTEAAADKFFSKIFSADGAVLKSIVFFSLFVLLNFLNYIL